MTGISSATFVLMPLFLAVSACNPTDNPGGGSPALQPMGSPTDNFGVYTGTVGGAPGFMVTFETPTETPFTSVSIFQRGGDGSGFGGGGLTTRETTFDFEHEWPGGGGQFYEHGRLSGPNRGAAVIRGVWTINERMVGRVTRLGSQDALLDFNLQFDPITLSTLPEGNAMPEGRYDIFHDGRDIGDFNATTPGAGTGTVTWPGMGQACAIGPSTAVRSPGTTRNVWRVEFNTDVTCSPQVWSVGYADMRGRELTFELLASRQLAMGGVAPPGEYDRMHLQLRRR